MHKTELMSMNTNFPNMQAISENYMAPVLRRLRLNMI